MSHLPGRLLTGKLAGAALFPSLPQGRRDFGKLRKCFGGLPGGVAGAQDALPLMPDGPSLGLSPSNPGRSSSRSRHGRPGRCRLTLQDTLARAGEPQRSQRKGLRGSARLLMDRRAVAEYEMFGRR